MKYKTIIVEKKESGITFITLNRPDRLNAINDEMVTELNTALDEAARDDDLRVLVITGTGSAFCSGGDLREFAPGTAEEFRQWLRGGAQKLVQKIRDLDEPTIAMVNGAATGGGFDLSLACDIRIGSDKARFMAAFTRIGLFPGTGGTWLLPRLLGTAKACEIVFTGDFIEAEEACQIGILNRLVPASELESATMELAHKIANGPPIALRLAKMQIHKALTIDFATALELAAAAETITAMSEDRKEGISAFLEKRKAVFRGK